MRVALLVLLAVGCTPLDTGFQKPDEDEDTGEADTDTDTDPVDTDDTDGDLDDDGFTPEEGDCDDDDVRVSPARPEDDGDGKDNDCDGRLDEEWSGFSVGRKDDDGAGSIIVLDTIGRDDATVNLSNGCVPSWLDHYGEGWVISTGGAAVSVVEPGGACTDLADFSDAEVYEYGVWGIAAMPDGFGLDGAVLATTVGSLVAVGADGTITELAAWVVDFEVPASHEFVGVSVAVDPASGEVGLFDYFGGFATWTPDGGFVVHKRGDYEAPTLTTSSGTHRDGGGWYTPGTDATTGAMGIYTFDFAVGDWVLVDGWADDTWSPYQVAIDGDSGDFYVTANVSGIYPSVYRIIAGSGFADDFFRIETDYAGYFYGIATNYTYGG